MNGPLLKPPKREWLSDSTDFGHTTRAKGDHVKRSMRGESCSTMTWQFIPLKIDLEEGSSKLMLLDQILGSYMDSRSGKPTSG